MNEEAKPFLFEVDDVDCFSVVKNVFDLYEEIKKNYVKYVLSKSRAKKHVRRWRRFYGKH